MEEIADTWVVAIAVNGFALEVLFVVPQLFFNIGEFGVELVVLARLAA